MKKLKPQDTFLTLLESWDIKLTKSLSICASEKSLLGMFRPHMKLLEISGHGIPWLTVFAIIPLLAINDYITQFSTNVFLALLLDIVIIVVIKAFFRRRRPVNNNMDMFATVSVDMYSFPSGHASRAMMLFFIFLHQGPFGYFGNIPILLWSLSICLSRILLGRHHIGDVVCGMLIGYFDYAIMSFLWLSATSCKFYLNFFFNTNSEDSDIEL